MAKANQCLHHLKCTATKGNGNSYLRECPVSGFWLTKGAIFSYKTQKYSVDTAECGEDLTCQSMQNVLGHTVEKELRHYIIPR